MTEELSRDVELELAELICIEHTLSPSQAVVGSAESGVLGPGKDTCLKIGTAMLEALSNQQPIAISFTEDELWLLRERVSIYTSQGANADLGLVIKAKLYRALLSIGNSRAAEAVLEEIVPVDEQAEEGMSREEVDDAVRRWQEVHDGRRPKMGPPRPGNRPNNGPEDETGPKTPAKS
ncbi:MAG: hypothetical protein Q7K38_03525 [Candidatus Wildermuthbacteria bacterium]|nr:hypothetical protein [Candidatus Wildermuthbacteria bacterium]